MCIVFFENSVELRRLVLYLKSVTKSYKQGLVERCKSFLKWCEVFVNLNVFENVLNGIDKLRMNSFVQFL